MFLYILVSSLSAGLIYYKRDYLKEIILRNLWNVTRKYHEYSIYLEEVRGNNNITDTINESIKEPILILQYNNLTQIEDISTLGNYYNLEGSLKMLIKNKFYKRIEKYEKNQDISFNTFNNIFITVEITTGKRNIDITKNMKHFYVEHNKLLDINFLQWFMKKFYKFELKEQLYYINIIDNNVNMLEIKKNQYILIKNNNDYSIETIN